MASPKKRKVKLHKIVKHDYGLYSLYFLLYEKIDFLSGQFLHLALDDFDPTIGYWPESRVFSIASEPDDKVLRIVYSVKGDFTKKMKDTLKEGEDYWIKLPFGFFSIERNVEKGQRVILIAGGTGISPYIPYLINTSKDQDQEILLYYGIKEAKHHIFREELSTAVNLMPKLKVNYYLEQGKLKGFNSGRISFQDIIKDVGIIKDNVFFISGPPLMIRDFKAKLLEKNVKIDNIITDDWE